MDDKNIPFSEPNIGQEEIDAVVSVLKSGWLAMGPKVIEFENLFKDYTNSSAAIAVNSCTSALFLSLKGLGIMPGDEIITTPFTFISTVNTIKHCNANPILVDIRPDSLNINPEKIKEAVTPKTKAIMPVHYAGHPCDMDEIMELAREKNLLVIEDAAHALGAFYKDKKIGSIGDASCFSFYANKNITTGEGGMITTNNLDLAQKLRVLRLHGMDSDGWKRYAPNSPWRYDVSYAGYKCNMTDIQAAIGICQLKKLDEFNRKRAKLVELYNKHLGSVENIQILKQQPFVKSANFAYTILVKNREKVIKELAANKISTSVFFTPAYDFSFYKNQYSADKFPVCKDLSSKSLVLPLYTKMSEEDVNYVCDVLKKIVNK